MQLSCLKLGVGTLNVMRDGASVSPATHPKDHKETDCISGVLKWGASKSTRPNLTGMRSSYAVRGGLTMLLALVVLNPHDDHHVICNAYPAYTKASC